MWEVACQGTKKKAMTVGDELGGGRRNSTKEGILSLSYLQQHEQLVGSFMLYTYGLYV